MNQMRTIDEVRTWYNDEHRRQSDFLGFGSEVLSVHLPEGWQAGHEDNHKDYPLTEEFVRSKAIDYLAFAFEKAVDHRGISASRSVIKMREYAWLLGMDDVVAFADDDSNYANYGVPILKRMAMALGVELPPEIAAWKDGEPCRPDCNEGCGR